MSDGKSSVLIFDSLAIRSYEDLVRAGKAISTIVSKNPDNALLILNGGYANSHQLVQTLARQTTKKSREQLEVVYSKFKKNFFRSLTEIPVAPSLKDETRKLLKKTFKDIFSLLVGISAVKEISKKTLTSLLTATSKINTILIFTVLKSMQLSSAITSFPRVSKQLNSKGVFIIPVESISSNDEALSARLSLLTKRNSIREVIIWSSLLGVQTVDPKIVANAKPIQELDYSTALEISYLGGKFLHPNVFFTLFKRNIPVTIHSQINMHNPVITIHKDVVLPEKKYVAITHRNDFVMLTLRSAHMFNQYGFLEKIFAICNQFKVPIETLTTSEISVTMTFHMDFFTPAFVKALSKLGETEYKKQQSIINVIGKKCWIDSAHTVRVLSSLSNITVGMISLGQSGNNLSIVIDSTQLAQALRNLHRDLFCGGFGVML